VGLEYFIDRVTVGNIRRIKRKGWIGLQLR
jgi:hypothetical protein